MGPFFNLTGNSNCLTSSQNPSISGSMDIPGPYQPRFNIFELTQAQQRVLGSPFKIWREIEFFIFFKKPYNMGVYELPWTQATKI